MKKYLVLLVLISSIYSCFCQTVVKNPNPLLKELIKETQVSSKDQSNIGVAWWIPSEFWLISSSQRGMSEEQLNQMLDIIEKYNLLLVVKGKVGLFGGVEFWSEQKIRDDIKFIDYYGDTRVPLKKSEVSSDMLNFLDGVKPILANMMGEMGRNFVFLLFDSKNSSDKLIADPYEDHDFEIHIGENDFYFFDLPLASLIMPKVCDVDEEEYNGKWKYCPMHGGLLTVKNNLS